MKSLYKTGDTVKVLSGEDKGKTGKVLEINRKKGLVLVEGVHLLTHYTRKSEQNPKGSIDKKEGFIACCKVTKVADGKVEKPTKAKAEKPAKKEETKKGLTKKV
jgi:large subunit ribosomal protein L24